MNRLKAFLRDLALIPTMWRYLVRAARIDLAILARQEQAKCDRHNLLKNGEPQMAYFSGYEDPEGLRWK